MSEEQRAEFDRLMLTDASFRQGYDTALAHARAEIVEFSGRVMSDRDTLHAVADHLREPDKWFIWRSEA